MNTDAYTAYCAAVADKKSKPERENLIIQDPVISYYALYVIKGPWPRGEPIIMTSPRFVIAYAQHILKMRWPDAEAAIADDIRYALRYINLFEDQILGDLANPGHEFTPIDMIVIKKLAKGRKI